MTQTINCRECGDTGYVPPFMDECFKCTPAQRAAALPVIDEDVEITAVIRVWDRPTDPDFKLAHAPKAGQVILHTSGEAYVWSGSLWKIVPTEALTPAEHAAKYPPVEADPELEKLLDKLVGERIIIDGVWHEWDGSDWTTGMTAAEARPLPVLPDPKTSADTFADLEAACDTVGLTHDEAMDELFGPLVDDIEMAAEIETADEMAAALDAADKPDYAAGYGEAGIYSDPSTSYGSAKKAKPATPAQTALIAKLIAERDPTNAAVWNAKARLDGGHFTARSASLAIDGLMKIPADPAKKPPRSNSYPGACTTCGGTVEAGAGRIEKNAAGRWQTYHLDGECLTAAEVAAADADKVTEVGLYRGPVDETGSRPIYRVRKSRMSHRLYAEKVVAFVGVDEVSFIYNANAMTFLRKSDRLTWQEARDWGVLYGACVACGRTLSDARSVVQGYGATCAGHHMWPVVSKKQADLIVAGTLTWEEATGTAV